MSPTTPTPSKLDKITNAQISTRKPNKPIRFQDLNKDGLRSNTLQMKAAKKRRNRAANKAARISRARNR